MLRRASEIFLGSADQKSLVKVRLSYVSAERHEARERERDSLQGVPAFQQDAAWAEDSLEIELKWCVSDNIQGARNHKLQAIELGKPLHTFEHVAVTLTCHACGARGEDERVSVRLATTTKEPKLSAVTFQSLGAESQALSLHLTLSEEEIADIQRICVQESACATFFKWLDFSFPSLTHIDCSSCNMSLFPRGLVHVGHQLRALNVAYNKIQEMPDKVVSELVRLEVLEACGNLLTALPASLSTLPSLRTLDLEDNRLTTIIYPFNKLVRLRKLLLKGNSLLYLPPLVGNATLQELSIANLVIKGNIIPQKEGANHGHDDHGGGDDNDHGGGGDDNGGLSRSPSQAAFDMMSSHHLKYEDVTTTFSETTSFLSPLKNAVGTMTQTNKWIPFFDLFVGRSEAHPLVLAAILQAFEDKEACEYVAQQERGVLQQLVLLTLSNDVDVVQRSSQCLISAFSKCNIMDRLLENNMQQCVSTLLGSQKSIDQESGIKLLSHIAYTSDQFSSAIYNDTILTLLATIASQQALGRMRQRLDPTRATESELRETRLGLDICGKALECLGNMALSLDNREKMVRSDLLLRAVDQVISLGSSSAEEAEEAKAEAGPTQGPPPTLRRTLSSKSISPKKEREREALRAKMKMALEIETNKKAAVRCAVRVIAILGLNSKVDRALNKQATTPQDKFGAKIGIRILSIDGGGAKGRCALEMCRVIERKTGKKINDLFDLIVGTSTGSIIALGMGALELSIDEVEEAYDTLTKAFRRSQGTNNTYERGWIAGGLEQMSGLYTTGTQNIRALFRGCMYNHELLENFYKRWARVPDSVDDERFCAFSRSMINLAPLGRPRVACLSSLTNCARPLAYVLCTYEFPPDSRGRYKKGMSRSTNALTGVHGLEGSSSFTMWQALRASTAAPLYVEGYVHNEELFLQDGALCSNNPVVVAFQEASCIWPDRPVELIVSFGNGVPRHELKEPKQKSVMETIGTIAEAATSVDRDHAAMENIAGYLDKINENGCGYFRFQPEDERCDVMLDEIDETKLRLLREAYTEYIRDNDREFDLACQALLVGGSGGPEAQEAEDAPKASVGRKGGDNGALWGNGNGNGVEAVPALDPGQGSGLNQGTKPGDQVVVCVQDLSLRKHGKAFGAAAGSEPIFDACLQNESCRLKVLSSEQCLGCDAKNSCISEVSLVSRYTIPSQAPYVASLGAMSSCLEAASFLFLDCLGLEDGFVAKWSEETFVVVEESQEGRQLLQDMRWSVLSETQDQDNGVGASFQEVFDASPFVRMKDQVLVLCDRDTVSKGGFGASAKSTVTLCTMMRLRPLEVFCVNDRVRDKVVAASHAVPPKLLKKIVACGPLAVIHPTGLSQGDDPRDPGTLMVHLLYTRILRSGSPGEAWRWLRENHPAADRHLRVYIREEDQPS